MKQGAGVLQLCWTGLRETWEPGISEDAGEVRVGEFEVRFRT